jgi:2'-5' RNA ligase
MPRLFFALLPNAHVRSQIERFARSCTWGEAIVVNPSQFHITLNFIGDVEADILPHLFAISAPLPSFKLELVRACVWENGIAVLEAQSSELEALHRTVDLALRAIGIPPPLASYRPHVTLARRAEEVTLPNSRPIAWSVDSFALMETPRSGASTYHVRQTYPLI